MSKSPSCPCSAASMTILLRRQHRPATVSWPPDPDTPCTGARSWSTAGSSSSTRYLPVDRILQFSLALFSGRRALFIVSMLLTGLWNGCCFYLFFVFFCFFFFYIAFFMICSGYYKKISTAFYVIFFQLLSHKHKYIDR